MAACQQHLSRHPGLSAAFPLQAREQAAAAAAAPAAAARPASADKVRKSVLILAAPGELAAAVQPEPAAGAAAAGAVAAAAHTWPADAAAAAKAAEEARAAAREQAIRVRSCLSVELAVHAWNQAWKLLCVPAQAAATLLCNLPDSCDALKRRDVAVLPQCHA